MLALLAQRPQQETIEFRIRLEEKGLIDRAAQVLGQNRDEFLLDAARQTAEETLFDQGNLSPRQKAYDEWLAVLDNPPLPNERLCRLLRTPAPWE